MDRLQWLMMTNKEFESSRWAELRRRLRRVKRLQRLHGRVQQRLKQEIEALEEFIRKHLQSCRWGHLPKQGLAHGESDRNTMQVEVWGRLTWMGSRSFVSMCGTTTGAMDS